MPIRYVAGDNIIFCLQPGQHRIYIDPQHEDKYCGLLPIGSRFAIPTIVSVDKARRRRLSLREDYGIEMESG
jgi:hypothetical protein